MDHATLKPTPSGTVRSQRGDAEAGTTLASASALPVGTRLREFEITGAIGEGGFSIVYAALDQRLGREVAIKEYIPASLARREAGFSVRVRSEQHEESFGAGLAGFMNEARLLAQFKHPALVEVLQFWEENGTAYMVMPRYHGRTLRQVLRERGARCDEAWLKRTLAPVLDVLELLHGRSVFHRDIAPDNILIQRDDRAVLLDLGSAREILGDREQSVTVVVKPGYAPLEQYSREFSLPQGPWTDVYAFGAVLHFAVTGAPPQASISRVMKDSRPLLAASPRPGFSQGFLKAIDAALALQPENRPQSAAELRDLLAIDDTPTAASPREYAERMLDALHVDEAITAIVSAEEMADIAAQLAGAPAASTASPEAAPPLSAPASSQASALLVDPMAAPPPVPAAPEFKDVEDLASGKLLPNTEDVRVVSESRLEARIDTEQPSAPSRRVPWLTLSAVLGGLVMAAAGLGWALKGGDAEAPPAMRVASTAETLSGERATTAPANRGPSEDANRARPEQGAPFAPEPGSARLAPLAAADPSPSSIFAQTPSANAAEPSPAVRLDDQRPQPGAAIPDDIWAPTGGSAAPARASEGEDPNDDLALVDIRQQQGPSALQTAGSDTTRAGSASTGNSAVPQPVRRADSAPELISVRLGISPWAEVWLGDERKGVSPPLRELRLPPGRHSVELRNSAFPAKTVVIEVRSGERPAIEHRFGQASQ
jgi:non-specific serine/threonine protein kinase